MKKVRVVFLARDTPTCPTKYYQTVWELWPVQYFGFRGDNYITKTVSDLLLSLARSTSTGPRPPPPFRPPAPTPHPPKLYSYQKLSKYVQGYQSYGAHKDASTISATGEIITKWKSKSCLSCMRHAFWSSSLPLLNIIKLSQTVWELWPAQDCTSG